MKSKNSCFFRQSEWEGGRSKSAKQIYAERSEERAHELATAPADEQEHFPILFINQIFVKFLGFQGGFFQKAPLVAEGIIF